MSRSRDYVDGVPIEIAERITRARKRKTVEKTLTIRMRGDLKEINRYCSAIGELSNDYDIEVEF